MEKKTFAFKLAEKKPDRGKWKAREGVSLAGCSDPTETGRWREPDNGVWC